MIKMMFFHLTTKRKLLTLSYTGGGKFAPDITNLSAISVPIALGSPKFMTLFHSRAGTMYLNIIRNLNILRTLLV